MKVCLDEFVECLKIEAERFGEEKLNYFGKAMYYLTRIPPSGGDVEYLIDKTLTKMLENMKEEIYKIKKITRKLKWIEKHFKCQRTKNFEEHHLDYLNTRDLIYEKLSECFTFEQLHKLLKTKKPLLPNWSIKVENFKNLRISFEYNEEEKKPTITISTKLNTREIIVPMKPHEHSELWNGFISIDIEKTKSLWFKGKEMLFKKIKNGLLILIIKHYYKKLWSLFVNNNGQIEYPVYFNNNECDVRAVFELYRNIQAMQGEIAIIQKPEYFKFVELSKTMEGEIGFYEFINNNEKLIDYAMLFDNGNDHKITGTFQLGLLIVSRNLVIPAIRVIQGSLIHPEHGNIDSIENVFVISFNTIKHTKLQPRLEYAD